MLAPKAFWGFFGAFPRSLLVCSRFTRPFGFFEVALFWGCVPLCSSVVVLWPKNLCIRSLPRRVISNDVKFKRLVKIEQRCQHVRLWCVWAMVSRVSSEILEGRVVRRGHVAGTWKRPKNPFLGDLLVWLFACQLLADIVARITEQLTINAFFFLHHLLVLYVCSSFT